MALASTIYNSLFRRTSAFAVTVMVSAVVFERMFDQAADTIFDNVNQGKLWKHIKHSYEKE